MKRNLLILAILFSCRIWAADYYWVGGAGTWSDLNHWRLGSSGGSIPSIVPSSADNVFFDANSGFTAVSKTVTLDANGFCNNMTWGNVQNSPQFITTNASFTIQLHGNLVMSPTTYYQLIFNFSGNSNATITSGGTIQGQFGMYIDKGTGSLTVTDSLVAPANVVSAINSVNFISGTFNIADKKMLVYSFISQNNNIRTLEMTNATVIANTGSNSGFKVTGINKTIHATGSTVIAFGYNTDSGVYNKTTITSAHGPNTVFVNNSTFSCLTFIPITGAVYSNIGANNIVDTLIFEGIGTINSNNTVGVVQFANTGTIANTGNIIRKIVCQNAFTVNPGNFTNTVDSLILAPNRPTTFKGTFNINKYLFVDGAPCEAYTEIYGDSTLGTINFASGAVADLNNVILTGVKATGPITPIALNGVDGGGNAGFTITEPVGTGTTLYWVNGPGDWNDRNHWSTASGGAGGACIPFRDDNVVFDANSGLATGTVTTSSSSFCKDMTWTGVGTVTFDESGTSPFNIYGSLVLDNSVTMNSILNFLGNSSVTITTNGSALGGLQFIVGKTGAASVTLTDNWSAGSGSIIFNSGGFNMSGRTVSIYSFYSASGLSRSLDISNATITVSNTWDYTGTNKSMLATGSFITSNFIFRSNTPTMNYPRVDLTYAGANAHSIYGTVFGQLTFTSSAVTSGAAVGTSNTIRRLEFKGAGRIAGNNTIDSLIFASPRNYTLAGVNTITKYFMAEAATCSGLTEIRGNATGTLAFGNAAEIHIANIYMQNITATGIMTPIAFNGADAGGNAGWTINSAAGSAHYWVGGSGDWNDPNHWSATSGGAGGACVPTVYDDVYFDAGSGFTAVSKTVTVNNGNAYCRNINWTGAANAPIWNQSASWTIEAWGDSIVLNPTATLNVLVYAKGVNPAFLKGNTLGNFDVYINKTGSTFTLLNNYNNSQTTFGMLNGALNASGLTLNIQAIDNSVLSSAYANNVFDINISNSNITAVSWCFIGSFSNLHSVNAANSSITVRDFLTAGMQYDTVNVTAPSAANVSMYGATVNSLTFTNPSNVSTVGITGSNNILGRVEYKGSGTISGTANVIDTLIFFPGNRYTLGAGTNNTVNDAWYGSGTPCRATEIVSGSTTTNATITKNGSPVSFDYVRLQRITAAGTAAPFEAQKHSTDLGNNTNWNIAPYDGAAPIYGLGPDIATTSSNFPMVLRTDGFFGSPSSQYTWNDNSTADTLEISGPGTYSVDVSFPDGCNISDAITVTLSPTLPVTLVSFTVKQVGCQSRLDWKVTDAINFSRFAVEKSTDGYTYSKVADIPYTGVYYYTWTDPASAAQTSYYRLKMVDADETYTYSNTVSARNDCQEQAIKVYPTVTEDWVRVALPPGYEHATIQVYNIWGQRVNPVITGSGTGRTVHLQSFPKATYVLQVVNGTERKSFTIVKP